MGVWRILDDADHSGPVAGRRPFFEFRKFLDRQIGDDKALEGIKAHTQGNGEFAFCQRISKLTLISANKKILLHEFRR